jgi:hypothetical protein
MKVFDFAYHGYLQALKVRDLKTFTICLSLELTCHKAGLLMQYRRKYQAKKVPQCLEVKVFVAQ